MITKKQHYYPRCLLKHFANDDKKVFVYIRKGNKETFMNYEKTCYYHYTYESDDQVDNVLERKLGKYESKIEPIIDNIIKNYNTNNFSVSEEDQQELFQYLWLQYLRTDAGRIHFVNLFENIFSYKPRKGPLDLEEIEKKENKDKIKRFNWVFKQGNRLEKLLKSFEKTNTMNFHIARSMGNLLTSDNPVIGTDNWAQIMLPIAPRICIVFQHDTINRSKSLQVMLTPDKTRYLNEATINTGNYFIISNENFSDKQREYIENRFNNKNWRCGYPHVDNLNILNTKE
ncbi:DUF4238 domain-containing protein [Staphylococcus haemolyticus]|uniref:DUF4238 domain-containing protein n=1 Tax=Staphylococcus haemolyticus TaxID=1283 RepID=UPI00187AF48C|nr:DUF4238 domain-containing protein [Staphylococcus haemolyticus]MBE7355446.1 DUF4238 domain-containing protein [Staphylococcus haemolyticus]MDT0705567.1 DUF4238 domain-containing protein [Staphylococcus haemolyticus]MDT0738606.1 DUF4238 domain-containing protein [Staphylococcus haemolyticus]